MKIGDTIITKGGVIYSIDEFVSYNDQPAIKLKSLNGVGKKFTIMEAYLNFYVNSGIYILKKKNNVTKSKVKFKRRHHTSKLKGKKS